MVLQLTYKVSCSAEDGRCPIADGRDLDQESSRAKTSDVNHLVENRCDISRTSSGTGTTENSNLTKRMMSRVALPEQSRILGMLQAPCCRRRPEKERRLEERPTRS